MKKTSLSFIRLIFSFFEWQKQLALKRIPFALGVVILLMIGFSSSKAQIGSGAISLSPQDTTVCPHENITITGSFASFIDNIQIDDRFSNERIDIGFPFVFYGQTFTKCIVSVNGFLSFDTIWAGMGSSYVYNNALNAGQLNNSIMMPFQDLNTAITGGQIAAQTYGQAPNRLFVLEFCKVPYFHCTTSLFTGQVILHETTNLIEIQIGDKPVCATWVDGTGIEGLHGPTNTLMDLVPSRDVPNVPWTATNDGRLFTPLSPTSYQIDTPFLISQEF